MKNIIFQFRKNIIEFYKSYNGTPLCGVLFFLPKINIKYVYINFR